MREGVHGAIRVDGFSRRLYSRRLRSTGLKRIAVVGIVALTGLVGAAGGPSAQRPSAQKPTYGTWGVNLAGMDNSVKPGDDFFDYANGTLVRKVRYPTRPFRDRRKPGHPHS